VPITQLGKKTLSRPIVVLPMIVTLFSRRQPPSSVTSGPMTQNGADLDVLGDAGVGVDNRQRRDLGHLVAEKPETEQGTQPARGAAGGLGGRFLRLDRFVLHFTQEVRGRRSEG
jgi:hypothetical protein